MNRRTLKLDLLAVFDLKRNYAYTDFGLNVGYY